MKKYVIEVVITEGSDEFWEELEESKSAGCLEILESVTRCLDTESWVISGNCKVKLKEFSA